MPAQSDHFDRQRFFNPTGPALQPLTAVPRMLLTPRAKWPRYVPEVARQPPPRDTARPVVTFVGHATFLIQTAAGIRRLEELDWSIDHSDISPL